jgi:hypothetical protein
MLMLFILFASIPLKLWRRWQGKNLGARGGIDGEWLRKISWLMDTFSNVVEVCIAQATLPQNSVNYAQDYILQCMHRKKYQFFKLKEKERDKSSFSGNHMWLLSKDNKKVMFTIIIIFQV